MGVNLRDLISPSPITLEGLKGRVIAIDAYNALYQFLAIIRQPDGSPLMDSRGRVTSHLSGAFYRTANLLEAGIRPVFVFDGKPPEMKAEESRRRASVKEKAMVEYKEALERGEIAEAKKYAAMTSKLTKDMVTSVKDLLEAMGVPWIQAPSEGEAQASYMTRKGDAWATVSQDYDSLLFGAPRLVRNLTISGRRKLPGKPVYVEVEPEIVKLEDTLSQLGITMEQLIDLGILLGTDFNPDGFKGIGPKRALKIMKEFGSIEAAVEGGAIQADERLDLKAIKEIFLNPTTTPDYRLEWGKVRGEDVVKILCDEYDFSKERVGAALERIQRSSGEAARQPSLEKWFG
ncbi:MAG: flap endonuclease-1 [Candidatus Methanomethylicia archaeon]|nr:flap endonuclease-1 [Candidatus Methanomethylicia archaeon]